MKSSTMNLHHAVTIFVLVLALIAIIVASVAISGDIDYKENSIPASAVTNLIDMFDGKQDKSNATLSATGEESLSAVVNRHILKNTNGKHLHIGRTVVQSEAADLNLLFGASNIGGYVQGSDEVIQAIPLGVTSEGVRFSNVSRSQLTGQNETGHVEIGVDTGMITNYRLELPTAAPTANQLLQATTPVGNVSKLTWANTGATGTGLSQTNGDIEITLNSGTATHDMKITNVQGTSATAIVIDATKGGIDIDADKTIAITTDEGNAGSLALTSTGGGIDIIATGTDAGDDIDINSNASVNIVGSETGVVNAIKLSAPAGGIDIDAAGNGVAIDASGTGPINIGANTDTGTISIGTGASGRIINIGHAVSASANVRALVIGLTSANTLSLTSTNALTLTDGTATLSLNGSGATSLTAATTVDLDCTGAMSLNSSGGVINIGDHTDAQNMNIGTSGARTIRMGNVTGATALALNSGTGGIALTSTGTGGITLASADTLQLDSVDALEINSSTGVINIGDHAISQNINIGTGGTRTITGGNLGSTKIDLKALKIDLTSYGNATESIKIEAHHADGGVKIESGSQGVTINGSGGPIVLNGSGGKIDIDSTNTAADSISLTATGGVQILCASTGDGVLLATGTSGVPISIGHTVSETTINDNLTVTGNHTITAGDATLTDGDLIITEALHGIVHTGSGSFTQSNALTASVTIQSTSGVIILAGDNLAAAAEADFTVTATGIVSANSIILISVVCPAAGTAVDNATMVAQVNSIGQNSFKIRLSNPGAGPTSASPHKIHYLIIN